MGMISAQPQRIGEVLGRRGRCDLIGMLGEDSEHQMDDQKFSKATTVQNTHRYDVVARIVYMIECSQAHDSTCPSHRFDGPASANLPW